MKFETKKRRIADKLINAGYKFSTKIKTINESEIIFYVFDNYDREMRAIVFSK